ncbi:hypothetical protein F2Q68_00044954 [Brassica cretica]|uniref:Uncharacterized protein n=1 Tax=Brassica cretica TaxID=69181 RepID=A0A8S9LMY4_BRACR|nr:hypothetical protein F2Q68_00044954 [Brassica cretica]
MAYSFILLADLKARCCSNTAEVCLLRFMEAQNVKNLSDPWLRRHQNQRLTEPSVVFFHVVPHGLGNVKIISKLILLWELLRIYVEMLFINKQHYKFVNRTTKVEPTPEDTKVDKEEEEPHKESNFRKGETGRVRSLSFSSSSTILSFGARFKLSQTAMGLIRLDSSLSLRLWLTKNVAGINHSMTPGETIAASSISIKGAKAFEVSEESVVATESLTREDLIAYFASGCKPKQKWRIGTEHEKFGFEKRKCIKEQRSLWNNHFSADILLHQDSTSIKVKHLKHDKETMDAKNKLTCEEPEEIPSPKLTDWLKSSTTPWRSPIPPGFMMMMMPSTPLAWRFGSAEFTLKEDLF